MMIVKLYYSFHYCVCKRKVHIKCVAPILIRVESKFITNKVVRIKHC